jgi:hypothetical protein
VRRLRRQNKDHFLEAENLSRLAREDKMSVMNWIEGAAVDADLFQTHFNKAELARASAETRAVA